MRKFISFLILAGLGLVVFGIYKQVTAAELSENPAAMATPGLNALSEQAQKPSPEPTIDLVPTLQALAGQVQNAEATANAAISMANDANAELEKQKNLGLSIQATENASIREHQARMKELDNEQIDLENKNLVLSNENLALTNENLALDNESKRLDISKTELENEASRIMGTTITSVVTVLGFLLFGFYIVKRHYEIKRMAGAAPAKVVVKPSRQNDGSLADELARVPVPASPIVSVTDARGMSVMLDDWNGIATLEQLVAVARGVLLEGKSLAISNWYGKDEHGIERPFTRSQFEIFVHAISIEGIGPERRILAYLVNGHAVLKDVGKKYFQDILDKYGR